jgi:thioredoxin-like negative regulator of GroEL
MRNEITSIDQIQMIIKSELAVLLYFYNDDCPPCLSLRPKVEKMIEESFPRMKLYFANSKQYPEIPASYSVFANPTLITFFDGKETKRFSKYVSIPELEQAIERYYEMVF